MTTVRILHFADLHLGVEAGGKLDPETGLSWRVRDVLDRWDEVCELAISGGVHLVLFAGDAFKHQHPSTTLQNLFAQRVRRLTAEGIRVFLLVGNHDLPKMASAAHPFSIYDALKVEGVVVGERAEIYRLALSNGVEIQVAALPHFSRHRVLASMGTGVADPDAAIRNSIADRVAEMAAGLDPSLPAVFCGHCHVNQGRIGAGQNLFGVSEIELSLSSLVQPGFAYYALGHLHDAQILLDDPPVVYSGSLERVDHGEGEVVRISRDGKIRCRKAVAKGVYLFGLTRPDRLWTLERPPVFSEVNARRFITIHAAVSDAIDPTADACDRLAGFVSTDNCKRAVVKIVLKVDSADRPRIVHRAIKEVFAYAQQVSIVLDSPPDLSRVQDPAFAQRMTEVQALDRFLETQTEWASDLEELRELGRKIIEEVTT